MAFPEYDDKTVIASLSNEIHHFEQVESTLRVIDKTDEPSREVAVISSVPPLSDEDREKVIEKLEELGVSYDSGTPMVTVLGVSDRDRFEDFIEF